MGESTCCRESEGAAQLRYKAEREICWQSFAGKGLAGFVEKPVTPQEPIERLRALRGAAGDIPRPGRVTRPIGSASPR